MPQPPRGGPVPRRVQYDAKAGAAGRRPGAPMQGGRNARGNMRRGIGSLARAKGTGQPVTQERSAHKRVVRIEGSIGLQALAGRMQLKAGEVLMKLISLGLTGVNINSTLDADTAKIVANEFAWEVEDVAVSEAQAIEKARGLEIIDGTVDEGQQHRPPVVTVMGHVDHGKTSLLDQIRKSNVVAGEAGGITQHIGAYSVETERGMVTFLDTPGHEAFTAMRARGAQTTDLVVLVVAADDGVMPQTREAINHARAAKVPIVVAINKCDKPDAQADRVRRELADVGLIPEEWGGETLITEVSAITRQGIDTLLEQIALQAEVLELRANPDKPGTGMVVEAELDRGRGPLATVLVTDGTLNRGDVVLAGTAYGKVRAMIDSMGRSIQSAGPSTPISIVGLNDVPSAGDPVYVVKDMKKAQEIAESRRTKERRSLVPSAGAQRMSLEDLARAMREQEQLELKVIIKADVQGSVEALSESLLRMSTEKVKVSLVHAAAGAITEGDVNLAMASGAIIIGFNVRPAGKASSLAQKASIEIRQYSIIYNVVDDIKAAMEGLLAPTFVEKALGKAEVRQTFRISKAGTVAGCMVIEGLMRRTAGVRLHREGAVIWEGKLSSLKRFKDDAREVKEGFECGISFDGYNDIKEGDVIEAFEMEQVKQSL
jgi:translation initiation factor IF-2